jgi:hypothetical protein
MSTFTHNALGEFRLTPRKIVSLAMRVVGSRFLTIRHGLGNRFRRGRVVDPAGRAMVSLTTHGPRLASVHLTIESIASGRERPRRIVLWVDPQDRARADASPKLARLVRRGLEVRNGDAKYRSHNKYIHIVSDPDTREFPFVTADDDVLYHRDWLTLLLDASIEADDSAVVAWWVRRMTFTDGHLDPYFQWPSADRGGIVPAGFFLGGPGALIPPAVSDALLRAGTGFLDTTPRADDVWLNAITHRAGAGVRQVRARRLPSRLIPGSQRVQLATLNVIEGLNDDQISATYSSAELTSIERESRE